MKKLLIGLVFVLGCGPQGVTGPQGIPGSSNGCSVLTVSASPQAPNGGVLLSCTDGSSALILNGTNVGVVQLCPSQGAPTYGNWPEVGFCINNVLYGLFQDSKGNLEDTTISSGNYSDAANSTTCSLSVSGCIVTQH